MAIFRKIHVSFWSDAYVSELNDKTKLFYLYLLTNERTTQLGVYEITKKQMAYDLGYSISVITDMINKIQADGKIRFNDNTSEIALKNWNRYNHNPSIKVQSLVDKEIIRIKDKALIEYLYSTDTVSIHNPQEEQEEEQTEAEELAGEKETPTAVTSHENKFDGNQFLKMFNETKLRVRGKLLKEHLTLTKTDTNNFNQLLKAGYQPPDFLYAIEAMLCADYPKQNALDNPAHVLRNDNFLKYLHAENLNQLKNGNNKPDRDQQAIDYLTRPR